MSSSEGDRSVISEDQLTDLNDRQREIYSEKLARFVDYLKTEGKEPIRDIGYAENSVNERISRFHRMVKWIWNNEEPTIGFTSEQGDAVNNALETDSFRKINGERFAAGSKRKMNDTDEIWLNREGNPYGSGSLNDLLDNLLEEAGISSRGRKLVWYSFRHSVGTYVYAEYTDLEMVAEQLRQKSKTSASKYVHPLPELKKEAAEIM